MSTYYPQYPFSHEQLEKIANLPLEVAALANNYPLDIINAAEFWNEPPFTDQYIPHLVEIYYSDSDGPDIFIVDGELIDFEIREPQDKNSIAVQIDDQWAYIQIEGKEILNRLGGIILPDVIIHPTTFLNSILKGGR